MDDVLYIVYAPEEETFPEKVRALLGETELRDKRVMLLGIGYNNVNCKMENLGENIPARIGKICTILLENTGRVHEIVKTWLGEAGLVPLGIPTGK